MAERLENNTKSQFFVMKCIHFHVLSVFPSNCYSEVKILDDQSIIHVVYKIRTRKEKVQSIENVDVHVYM